MADHAVSVTGITRRTFLACSSMVAAAAVVSTAAGEPLATHAAGRCLVLLHLAGGNDPWNTLVPLHESEYRRLRPTLALSAADVLAIPSAGVGLHPSMAEFHALMGRQRAAILCGVGIPSYDDSHAHTQLAWNEAALPLSRPRDGWLLKAARATPGATTLWTCDATVPRAFRRADQQCDPVVPLEHSIDAASVRLTDRLNRLADRLARCTGPVIAYVTLTGFDMHRAQSQRHAELLSELSQGLASLQRRLAQGGIEDRVLTLTYSEIGRSLAESDTGGTGHGPLSLCLVTGKWIESGVHGLWSAARPDAPPVDFRRVQAAVLTDWLGVPATNVIGRQTEPIPFVRAMPTA